jgi:AP-1 complex subunit mu
VITYELLDEMMDFGYPQATEAALLKEYIPSQTKFHLYNKNSIQFEFEF